MLRITSGSAKNRKLKTPSIPGYRAVQEVAKLAIFSIIGESIVNTTVLDLFAGSGNMGIEALSRGAKWCDFVDIEKPAVKVITENVKMCGFAEQAEISGAGAVKFAANTTKSYDFVFMDPFYEDTALIFLFKQLEEILKPDGKIFYLHAEETNTQKLIKDTKLQIIDTRHFGKSFLTTLCVSA